MCDHLITPLVSLNAADMINDDMMMTQLPCIHALPKLVLNLRLKQTDTLINLYA